MLHLAGDFRNLSKNIENFRNIKCYRIPLWRWFWECFVVQNSTNMWLCVDMGDFGFSNIIDYTFAKLESVKLSTSQVELRLALLSLYTHPPGHVYLSLF